MNDCCTTQRVSARTVSLWPLAPLLLWSACTTAQVVDVVGSDDSVLFTDGRLSWALGSDASPGQESAESEPERRATYLELDLSHGGGQDEIALAPGQVIVFAGQTFPGESTVFFDLTRVLVDIRGSFPRGDGFSVDGFVGLESTSMDVTVRGQGHIAVAPEGSKSITSLGPALGGALTWRPSDLLRFSVEGRVGLGLSSTASCVQLRSVQAGVDILPFEHIGLFLGWRSVSYEVEFDGPSLYGLGLTASALDLKLAGPVLAIGVRL